MITGRCCSIVIGSGSSIGCAISIGGVAATVTVAAKNVCHESKGAPTTGGSRVVVLHLCMSNYGECSLQCLVSLTGSGVDFHSFGV